MNIVGLKSNDKGDYMPQIILKLDITVNDYGEVLRAKGGLAGGFLSMFGVADSMLAAKIDSEIEAKIKEELGPAVASNVALELKNAGIDCSVDYEYL